MSEAGEQGGTLRDMDLDDLMAGWRVGSGDWGWAREFKAIRTTNRGRLDMLATSIQEAGMHTPILLGSDGRVWDGHHRVCAALMLGMKTVPVEVLEASRG